MPANPGCTGELKTPLLHPEFVPCMMLNQEEEKQEEEKEEDSLTAMTYSKSKNMSAFLSKVSATAEPIKGTPIDQLDKRLALLKY